MKPESLLIGVYPRDDVKWPGDGQQRCGLIEVRSGESHSVVASQVLGEFFPPLSPDLEVGSAFDLLVTASDGIQSYEEMFCFLVTGSEDDVANYTVGPGITIERGRWGRWGRKNVLGFEFGATVMGAVPRPR